MSRVCSVTLQNTRIFASKVTETKFLFSKRLVQTQNDYSSQKALLDQIKSDLNIQNNEDFYKLSTLDVVCNFNVFLIQQAFKSKGGKKLLQSYKHPYYMLSALNPEYPWLPWMFESSKSKVIWDDIECQKMFLDWASQQLNVNNDWNKDLQKLGGEPLLKKYNGSIHQMLSSLYPEYSWLPWITEKACPRNYWEDPKNRKNFINWAADKLNIKDISDWYKVTQGDFQRLGGGGLLAKYSGSPYLLLSSLFPEYEWLPWKFERAPLHFWDDVNNQRRFLEWAAKELNISDFSGWYSVTIEDFIKLGGASLLAKYNDSVSQLLTTVLPEHKWKLFKFSYLSAQQWHQLLEDVNNKREYIKYLEEELKIEGEEGWKRLEAQNFQGNKIIPSHRLKTVFAIVREIYNPSNLKEKNVSYKKTQYKLKAALQSLFPDKEVFEEYKHPDIIGPSGYRLELDFYYPQLKLAVEQQGAQHFKVSPRFHSKNAFDENIKIDTIKKTLCQENGITMVEVPYWWNRKRDSLEATIYLQRPELFNEAPKGTPISSEKPTTAQKRRLDTEETMRKKIMTATEWDKSTMDPTGWWLTEKFDGVRVFWNGTSFYTRQGKKLAVPESMTKNMPSVALDGELWTQYGLHQEASLLCNTSDEEKWKRATFWVFDAPEVGHKPYEDRMEFLEELNKIQSFPSFVKIVETVKCQGAEHLKEYFNSIVVKGGEGVMLREPQSLYRGGRSNSLRKYKEYFDTEVKVVENEYPYGFKCSQVNGKDIFVSITDNYDEAKNIKKGAVITVKHSGTNVYGTLQYPKFFRERLDVKWSDLIKT